MSNHLSFSSCFIQALSLLSLLHFSRSDATAATGTLSPRQQGSYRNHDPNLNQSLHTAEFFTFLSRPDITHAPRWDIHVHDESRLAPGYWFISPYANFVGNIAGASWTAPHIYNAEGQLIWWGGAVTGSWTVSDFRVSDVQGKPMLTFVHHHDETAFIIDETYNVQHKVPLTLSDTEGLNGHEFVVVDEGTRALHFFNEDGTASREESAKIGFQGRCHIKYHGFRELDTRTWEPVFSWAEQEYISTDETYATQEYEIEHCKAGVKLYDLTHLNAMHKFPDGDYLISSRRTFALYKVSHKDGSIVWRLGGKKSDFLLDTAWTGQHGARVQSQNSTHIVISFLDNARYTHEIPPTHENSRGLFLTLHITEQPMRATTLLSIDQPKGEYNAARGNVQVLPNGNIRNCWVTKCLFSEHDKDGNELMRAELKPAFTTYRSYKFEWKGLPTGPPDVHAAAVAMDWKIKTVVHVSWNGATEVNRWRLWHSNADGELLQVIAQTHWQGFESSMESDVFAQYVVVEALHNNGNRLGRSDLIRTIVPHELADAAAATEQEWQKENGNEESANVNEESANVNEESANVNQESAPTTTQKLYETVHDPIVQIVGGLVIAVGVSAVAMWIGLRLYKRRTQAPWWTSQEKTYEPVSTTED